MSEVVTLKDLYDKVNTTIKTEVDAQMKANTNNKFDQNLGDVKLDEEIVKDLQTAGEVGTVDVNIDDAILKVEERYNFSLDDNGVVISKLQKAAVKLYGTMRNTLTTEVYPNGIPRSVKDNIHDKLRKILRAKKETFKHLKDRETEIQKEINIVKSKTKVLDAKEYDNNYDKLIAKKEFIDTHKRKVKAEIDVITKLGTDTLSGKEYAMKHILHVKTLLTLGILISEIMKNNYTMEDVKEKKLLSDLEDYTDKVYSLIQDVIEECKSMNDIRKATIDMAEIELDVHKSRSLLYVEFSKQLILLLVEMLGITLVEPAAWKEYKAVPEEEIPEDKREEFNEARKYVLQQAIGYIEVIINTDGGKYNLIGENVESLRLLTSFANIWIDKSMIESIHDMQKNIDDIKYSLLDKHLESFKKLANFLYKEENELFSKVFTSVIVANTKIDALYFVLLLV